MPSRHPPARPPDGRHALYHGNEEPPLQDLLDDAIVRCLMESDGVRMTEILAVIRAVRKAFQ